MARMARRPDSLETMSAPTDPLQAPTEKRVGTTLKDKYVQLTAGPRWYWLDGASGVAVRVDFHLLGRRPLHGAARALLPCA
jgi:hypothetical protein